jgi:dTMP kinase
LASDFLTRRVQLILVLEGIDGAGKGEACQRLPLLLGAALYKSPPEHMREEQNRVNAFATDDEHYAYFIEVIREASREILALAKVQDVVVDRYWMTTVVYHRAMGISAGLEDMGDIVMPDATVYLTVSPEVQAVRLSARGMSPGDRRMIGKEHLIRRFYEEAISEQPGVVTINTDTITPAQVANLIIRSIPFVV